MAFTDWVTVALILGGIVLESRRGSLTAWVDVIGVIVAYKAASYLYPQMFTNALPAQSSFAVLFGMVMVPVIFLSMNVSHAMEKYMVSIDFFLGGLGGAMSGMVLSAVMFEYIVLGHGYSAPEFAQSIFRPIVFDLTWYQQLEHRMTR
jgi:threonine/homoserine efflux transporter RhtA